MDIRKLQRAIVDGLEDVKGQDIQVFNTEHLSALFERVIVASGTSNRQTKALAAGVRDKVRERGFRVLSTEGADNGEWIIVDCGAAVVHIMQPAIRDYYHLEEIWGDKPVRMKLGAAGSPGLVKASEPMPARNATPAPAKRKRSTDRAADEAPAPAPAPRKSGARPAAPPARKKTARQPAAVARRGLAQPTKLRSGAHRAAAGKGTAAGQPARKTTRGTR